MHLSGGKFSPAAEVRSVKRSRGVNHHQGEPVLAHQCTSLLEKLVLLISVVSSCKCDIVKNLLLVKSESFSDWNQSLWSERAFRVDVHGHAFATALRDRQLARDTKCVADLSLSCSEFSEDLCDASRLNTTAKKLVQTCRARRELDHLLPLLKVSAGRLEAHLDEFAARLNNLVDFVLRETLHRDEVLLGCEGNRLYCVEACLFELLDVASVDAFLFEGLDGGGTVELDLFAFLLLLFGLFCLLHQKKVLNCVGAASEDTHGRRNRFKIKS